jgi:hypothetical protein
MYLVCEEQTQIMGRYIKKGKSIGTWKVNFPLQTQNSTPKHIKPVAVKQQKSPPSSNSADLWSHGFVDCVNAFNQYGKESELICEVLSSWL